MKSFAMDLFTKAKRSEVMSRIRSVGNKSTELRLIEIFRHYGIRGWRRRQRVVGNPDFVFRKQMVCIFVDGCFWHGCPRCYKHPTSNVDYWEGKLRRNRSRAILVNRKLREAGWCVLRIWEHQLDSKREAQLVARLLKHIEPQKKSGDSLYKRTKNDRQWNASALTETVSPTI